MNKTPHFCDTCFSEFKIPESTKINANTLIGEEDSAQTCHLGNIYTPFYYAKPLSKAVLGLKYSQSGMAASALAPFMAKCLGQGEDLINRWDYIIPVPLTKRRQRERGYNQALLLAREVSKLAGIEILDNMLVRIKQTKPQQDMTPDERIENQKNAFELGYNTEKESLTGKKILIVDDVITSGATLNECAKILRTAGAEHIDALAIARVEAR